MRTIFKARLLKQGSRGPAVEDVQNLLNAFQKMNPIWTKTKPLVVDSKYGPLTEGKARDFQKSAALVPDGIVGPATCAVLFAPQADRVDKAQGIATNWAFLARAAVQTLRAHVRALQFNQPSPTGNLPLLLDALRTHFHIDLAGGSGPSNGGSLNPLDLLTSTINSASWTKCTKTSCLSSSTRRSARDGSSTAWE
jgi:peptidoglycan hydrolase-like protein with peptidoglycan-binding domain